MNANIQELTERIARCRTLISEVSDKLLQPTAIEIAHPNLSKEFDEREFPALVAQAIDYAKEKLNQWRFSIK